MSSRQIALTPTVDDAIRRHGEEAYPHECCGALVGCGARVTATVPLPNTTEEGPRRRFLVRPSDYQLAESRAAGIGGELLGFYHSHPDHPARPSQYDLDHAWPTFAYLIVAVASGRAGNLIVWWLKEDRSNFEEGELHYDNENSDSDTTQAVCR